MRLGLMFGGFGILLAAAGIGDPGGGSAPVVTPPTTAAPTPPTTTPGSTGASPTPAAHGDGHTPPSPESEIPEGNWKQLRTQYDKVKGDLATAQTQTQVYNRIYTEATGLATQLGYTAEDLKECMEKDPVKTLAVLRHEADEAAAAPGRQQNQRQAPNDRTLDSLVDSKLKPVTEHINRQIAEATMAGYKTALDTSITSQAVLKDAPQEVTDLIRDYIEESIASDPAVLQAMKFKGDFSAVDTAVKFVVGRLHGAFVKWQAAEMGKPARGGRPNPAAPGVTPRANGKFTLDDIIDDPGVLGNQYAR